MVDEQKGSLVSCILASKQSAKRALELREALAKIDYTASKRSAAGGSVSRQGRSAAFTAEPHEQGSSVARPQAAAAAPPVTAAAPAAGSQRCAPSGSAAADAHSPPATAAAAAVAHVPPPTQGPLPARLQSGAFYSAASKRLQEVEERVLRFLANVQARLGSSSSSSSAEADDQIWEVFPVQQPAFDYADAHNGPNSARLRVFSSESGPEGRRRFLAATYPGFWRRYRELPPQHRHFYEIIRQGWPCHLYFDLEFQRHDNPGVDGEAAMDALLSLVGELLLEKFGLHLDDSWVLELDSSTPSKFSRHLIVRAPDAAFASNAHVGAFVRELCARALERRGGDPQGALLVVKKPSICLWPVSDRPQRCIVVPKGEEETLFVDLGVYSRNRAFRLYLSSKAGKDAVLQCTGRFGSDSLTQQELFQRCLICNVEPAAVLLRCFDESSDVASGAAVGAGAALRLLGGGPRGALTGKGGAAAVHYGPSPYPLLEEFIISVCKEGGVQGSVRSWVLLDGGSLLLLNMCGNRWCGNVGRAHKSNGIFYVVDLQQGWWAQRCYDPECRAYRSPLAPLPDHLLALYNQQPTQQQGDVAAAAESPAAPFGDARQPEQQQQQTEGTDQRQQSRQKGAEGRVQQQQKQGQAAGQQVESQQGSCWAGGAAWGGWEREGPDDIPDELMLEALQRFEQAVAGGGGVA